MFLQDFRETPNRKIKKINSVLKEQFGISISRGFPRKEKLEKVLESAEKAIIKLRGTNKMFHLEPDYAKFLGIKDVVETMINEGMYAESPAYMAMKEMLESTVRKLMDSGYTMDEAVGECMNRYRMDTRFAYDDDHVMPIVITAAKSYMDECGSMKYEAVEEVQENVPAKTDLDEKLLKALAEEIGIKLEGMTSYDAIETKLNEFAKVAGKSRDAVVGFLQGLDEASLTSGIQYFGRKIAEQNAFNTARDQAIAAKKSSFTFNGREYDLKSVGEDDIRRAMSRFGSKKDKKNESLLSDIVDDILNEEVDVEQAEVVMAVRAMADDIQDQVERIGRMINEELPAIADQMRSEMGASTAQAFSDTVSGVLTAQLENAKATKAGLDDAVAQLTGGEVAGAVGDTGGLAEPEEEPVDTEEPAVDVNEPAAAGPEEEPLGRAAI